MDWGYGNEKNLYQWDEISDLNLFTKPSYWMKTTSNKYFWCKKQKEYLWSEGTSFNKIADDSI